MNAKQINWFRNRKCQKRAETAIGWDGKRHRNQSLSQNRDGVWVTAGASIQFNQTSSIYEYKIFTRNTRIIQSPTTTTQLLSFSLTHSCSCSCSTKKEIKSGRHVATLLLIWQTDGDADVDSDAGVWLKWTTFVCDCVRCSGVHRATERERKWAREGALKCNNLSAPTSSAFKRDF